MSRKLRDLLVGWLVIGMISDNLETSMHDVQHLNEVRATEPIANATPHTDSGPRLGASPSIPDLTLALQTLRSNDLLALAQDMLTAKERWYWMGNVFETAGQAARYLAPLLTGLGAGLNNQTIGFLAMGTGLTGEALAAFARYAHQESKERGMTANQIFREAGIATVPLLRSYSDMSPSNTSPAPGTGSRAPSMNE